MSADKAIQIKSLLTKKKEKIKHQKMFRNVCLVATLAVISALCVITYAKGTVNAYYEKELDLNQDKKQVESVKMQIAQEKIQIEEQKVQIEEEKNGIQEKQEELATTAEQLAKNNQSILEENMRLQDTLKMAASVGITPQNFDDAAPADTAVDYSKLKYLGEFEGTAYTPSPDECSNNLGYTASGKPIVAGVSIAVDTEYWKLGTEFYIEGLGYVVAMDTGNAVSIGLIMLYLIRALHINLVEEIGRFIK